MIRKVTKKWKIIEVVLRYRAYDTSFNSEKLAGEILKTMEVEFKLDINYWRCFMADRAATNTCALKQIITKARLNVTDVPCISHGLSRAGNAFDTPSWTYTSQKLGALVKYKMCKARGLFKEIFHEEPIKVGGVRWWQRFEHAKQVDRLSLPQLNSLYVKTCHEKKYSKETATKLYNHLSDPVLLSHSVVETAAVVDTGKKMVELTYIAESSQPMVLSLYPLINRMVVEFQERLINYSRLEESCALAAGWMVGRVLQPVREELVAAKATQQNAALAKHAAGLALTKKKEEILATNNNNINNQPNDGVVEEVDNEEILEELAAHEEEARLVCLEATELMLGLEEDLDNLQVEERLTKEDFMEHAMEAVQPGIDYVLDKFSSSEGPYANVMCMLRAAQLFNPLEARGKEAEWLVDRADSLLCFGFPVFLRESFMEALKGELQTYKQLVCENINWEAMEGASAYDKKLKSANVNLGEEKEWTGGAIEVARRTFEWWGTMQERLPNMAMAVRQVVLVQTSSASVERVFSLLGLILKAIGCKALDETMELRVFERVNRPLYSQH